MKTCSQCFETKPFEEFYAHPKKRNVRISACKDCTRFNVAKNRERKSEDLQWVEKELERHRKKSAKARAAGKKPTPEQIREGNKRFYSKHKEKHASKRLTDSAIRSGKLQRQPCEVCGEQRSQAHHDDYSKPLNVRWLCVTHHNEHHVEQRRRLRAKKFKQSIT